MKTFYALLALCEGIPLVTLTFIKPVTWSFTETKMSSFWRNFHHWLHWKLSFWQLPVQPVMIISSKWRHFRFCVWCFFWYAPEQTVKQRSFGVSFDMRLNKRLSKQSGRHRFETPSRSLWRCSLKTMMLIFVVIVVTGGCRYHHWFR